MKFKLIFFILIIAISTGCNRHSSEKDAENYVTDLDKIIAQSKKNSDFKLPNMDLITYHNQNLRSPFDMAFSTSEEGSNPLRSFPLNLLHFKGTLTQNRVTFAYILAPDNRLYRVKLGDIIGDHYGRITKVSSERIEVEEQVENTAGIAIQTTKRIVTLQLKDNS